MLGYKSLKQFLTIYGFILLLALLGFVVRAVKFDAFGLKTHAVLFLTTLLVIPFIWELLRFVNRFLNRHFPFEKNLTGRLALQLFVGAVLGLLLRALIYFFGEPHLPFELDSLFLATTWALYPLVTVAINLGFFTSYFIDRWKDGVVRAAHLEREKSQVQFNNLKNQLNPHFLFNALTSLNSLIYEDQHLASAFLQQLAKVYRYLLEHEDKTLVSLDAELNFIQHYISLLQTRFDKALIITLDVAPEAREKAIAPVTLQILIENALKHNVTDVERPLSIEVASVGDYLVVRNTLQLRRGVDHSTKRGLSDLRNLYQFLTPRPVAVERTDDQFLVRIPLL